ncbi:tyrosine-type recombinase/integrase [Terrihabitans sp. B22-R8]|uniref:tyrosine-type recombinase/integrase n=1 Tax=Terrihabitans sp. B22-R8 TaxID=3425128 RepID=UPI00403C95A8
MSAPYLKRLPNGIYQYRRVIPDDLRGILGKREIKQSLGKDFAAAMKQYADVHKKADEAVEKAKLGTPPDTVRAEVLDLLKRHRLTVDDVEAAASVDRHDPDSVDLAIGMGALVDELREQAEEAQRNGRDARQVLEAIQSLAKGVIPKETHTVATALEFYRKSKAKPDAAKNKALEDRINNLKGRMAKALGVQAITKRPLENFTNENARKTRDFLLKDGLDPASVKRMIGIVKAAINEVSREYDLTFRNPFEKLKIAGAEVSREDRHPLTDDDMAALAPVMMANDDDPLSILWVILRDTGARPSEILTLKVQHVDTKKESVSIPFGKTKNAKREVPLSPEALKGVKKLIDGKKPGDFLYPKYATGRGPDSASQTMMKRFRKVIKDEKQTVYSLRHRMTDKLRDVECPEEIRKEILGHDTQNVAMNYGKGYALARKREYLSKVWSLTK